MIEVQIGDSRRLIHGLKDKSIDCVVTSPPYWGLRDYKTEPIIFDGLHDCEHNFNVETETGDLRFRGANTNVGNNKNPEVNSGNGKGNFCFKCGAWRGQLGLEPTPELFIKHLLDFFDDIRLKLKDEGNVFVNLGDTYAGSGCGTNDYRTEKSKSINGIGKNAVLYKTGGIAQKIKSIPAKSKCLIPERFAIGMVDRGWICRNDLIWWKPNHMPESVTDRWTKAHEIIYFFTNQADNYFDMQLEPYTEPLNRWGGAVQKSETKKKLELKEQMNFGKTSKIVSGAIRPNPDGKHPNDVWRIPVASYPESHFAVFPLELVRRPILAGCPVGGTVLDPFAGSGTVGEFCRNNERDAILFELNPDYKKLIEDRAMLKVPELSEWCSTKEDA